MARNRPKGKLKDELRTSRTSNSVSSFIVIGILVVVAGIIAGLLYWRFFLNRTFDVSDLVPIDSEVFMTLEWREDSVQNTNLNDVSMNLGGPTTVDSFVELLVGSNYSNSTINFREDIAPWLGDDFAVVRRDIEKKEQEVNLYTVGDEVKKDEFLGRLKSESDSVGEENYKGIVLTSLFGDAPVVYAEIGNVVAVSAKPQGIKEVVDVSAKDLEPLSDAKDYQLTENNLSSESLFRAFVDVAPFFRAPAQLGLDPGVAIDVDGQARMGLNVVAEETGLGLQVFVPEVNPDGQEINEFTSDILAILPNDTVGYIGGNNLANFARDYLSQLLGIPRVLEKQVTQKTVEEKYGINLEEDLYSWMQGEYALAYMDQETDDFALVFKVDDVEAVRGKLLNAEKAIVGLTETFADPGEAVANAFEEVGSASGPIRYLPLPGRSGYFINYGFRDNFLVLATSRVALDKILQPGEDTPSLLTSKVFALVNDNIPEGDASGELYLNGPFLVDFLDSLGFDFTLFERHIVGSSFKSMNVPDGILLTGFLPII